MKILEVNYTDLVGHIFNGYDLHLKLNRLGHDARMIVLSKKSVQDTVVQLRVDTILHQQLIEFEKKHSVSNVIFPYAGGLEQLKEFQEAELVHYHILHNQMLSLLDYPRLMNQKPSVWTIHDPWIITGNCIHPLECPKWRNGCGVCNSIQQHSFKMNQDNTRFMWNIKKKMLGQINPHIVIASDFMKTYLQDSPITRHFNKIHTIPFGIDINKYNISQKADAKRKFKIFNDKIVIGFRVTDDPIKGCKYIYEALMQLKYREDIVLLCVGGNSIPEKIRQQCQIIELGWIFEEQQMIEFMKACDIFLMPSLAESFGLMSIESLASGCAFICFKNTVMAAITQAQECGISVEYRSSKALARAIEYLIKNPDERKRRGLLGHELVRKKYSFERYADSHKKLYEKILEESLKG
ncbi:MAG: glycosyltransferase [Lachnospiraceae bacterium]|jgi:glycosyltransferase involved in cell wall biosynthesis|nr:glycosyltransferase [Lachnospiraceae bacterium]